MQRKFVRELGNETDATYKNFRIWLDDTTLTEEIWESVMTDDELYDCNAPNSLQNEPSAPHVESEIDVYTYSGARSSGVEDSGEDA